MPTAPFPFGLIGGTGRSGTTILRDLIAAHPDVAFFPELRFPTDPDGLADFLLASETGWSPYRYDVRLRRLMALLRGVATDPPMAKAWRLLWRPRVERMIGRKLERRYLGHRAIDYCPTFLDRVNALERDLMDFSWDGAWTGLEGGIRPRMAYHRPFVPDDLAAVLGRFWLGVASDTLAHAGGSFFVEKETWSILSFDTLRRLVPHAKLVHIVRDPRDVVASFLGHRWAPNEPAQAAQYYQDVMRQWWAVRERVPEDAFLELRLEDLVADPRAVLGRLCDFWGLRWDDALLSLDLGGSRPGRWKRDLPREAHDAVTMIVQPTMASYGYE